MSIWYSQRKKEGKSLRLAAVGKSAFCFAELHYDVRSLLPVSYTHLKWKLLLPQLYLILPLVVLVYMIMIGFTMATAAVYATLYLSLIHI